VLGVNAALAGQRPPNTYPTRDAALLGSAQQRTAEYPTAPCTACWVEPACWVTAARAA